MSEAEGNMYILNWFWPTGLHVAITQKTTVWVSIIVWSYMISILSIYKSTTKTKAICSSELSAPTTLHRS